MTSEYEKRIVEAQVKLVVANRLVLESYMLLHGIEKLERMPVTMVEALEKLERVEDFLETLVGPTEVLGEQK